MSTEIEMAKQLAKIYFPEIFQKSTAFKYLV